MKFPTVSVAELLNSGEAEVKTGPFGTQLKASDYVSEGTPVINVRNIGFGNIREDKLEYIGKETVQRLASHLLRPKDIVFGRKGAVERHVFIQAGQSNWFQGSDCLRLRLSSSRILPRFASYYLLTHEHQQWMMGQCSHGATMASLNQDIISRIQLPCPPLATQRRIASILSAYDDLIDNNTRRIAILEEMARRIYEEWFVRFRFPGHEQVRMVESDLGLIPEGWRVSFLGEAAAINAESIRSAGAPVEILYIDIASVVPGAITQKQPYRFSEAPGRARRVVRHGDVIWSCVRPNRRSYALVLQPEPALIASTGFAVISARSVPYSYLYFAVTTDDFVGYLTNHATGAAYPAVTASTFEAAPFLIPEDRVADRFHAVAAPLLDLSETLKRKNANLRATRDLLLPKLISGELDVSTLPEPEEAVAA